MSPQSPLEMSQPGPYCQNEMKVAHGNHVDIVEHARIENQHYKAQKCNTTKPTAEYHLMQQEYAEMRDFLNKQWDKPRMIDHILHKVKIETISCFKYNYSLDKIV